MSRRKQPKTDLAELCAAVHPDDGVDPRKLMQRGESGSRGRKTLQLCRQVHRAVDLALRGSCRDPALQALLVAEVLPAPDEGHLLVIVQMSPGEAADPQEVLARLERVRGALRGEVAAAITRKRTPELSFRLA